MSRTEFDEKVADEMYQYITRIKMYAEDTIRHHINSIGDNASDIAETLTLDFFADMPEVTTAHGLYTALEEIEGQADYFCDNVVSPQDWAANLSESDLFELLENYGNEIDEYVGMAGVEKDGDESFAEYVVRVLQWWYHDTIVSGCTIAVQDIHDRLRDLMLELEEEYGDEYGTIHEEAK